MLRALENLAVADGDPVRTEHIATALTAGVLPMTTVPLRPSNPWWHHIRRARTALTWGVVCGQ
jgi:hypothetical protein